MPVGLRGNSVRKHSVLPNRNTASFEIGSYLPYETCEYKKIEWVKLRDDTKPVSCFGRKKNALWSRRPLQDNPRLQGYV